MFLRMGNGLHIVKCQAGPCHRTGWRDILFLCWVSFLLGCPGPLCGGSLQPRVQGRVGPLGEQWPAELMVKTEPKRAAQHYNSVCPTEGVVLHSLSFTHISAAAPETSWKKAIHFLGICFLLVQLLEPTSQGTG